MTLRYHFPRVFMFAFLIIVASNISFGFEKNKNDRTHRINKNLIQSLYISKVANVWTVLWNDGYIGYDARTKPSFEWPGGSGNHHVY